MHRRAPQYLHRDDGTSLAYHFTEGCAPGVLFCTGFKSDMQGGKALALEGFCREQGRSFTRFDYFGHGESSGDFEDGTIGRWADDARAILDQVTRGPQLVVGSSMGGWVMLLLALKRPERIAALLGIAAAPDFTEEMRRSELSKEQLRDLELKGYCEIPNCYDDQQPYQIRKTLLDEARNHLLLDREIGIDVPVRLIQGMCDEDVPWKHALQISDRLHSNDVEIQFVKNGNHRLSEPEDIRRMLSTLSDLLDRNAPS